MARNTDLRSYVAKTFPTLTIEEHYVLVRDLLKIVLETKKKSNFSVQHGQSFEYKELKEIVHVKPGNRITFMMAGVTFSERNLVQFVEELKNMSLVRPRETFTFAQVYQIHNYLDVNEFMDVNEIAAFNGEIYSTIMKRWHNRYRAGADNPSSIRRRLKSVDAFIEIILSDFHFDEREKKVLCNLTLNGDEHKYGFIIPVAARLFSGDNVKMGKELNTTELGFVHNTWVNSVTNFSRAVNILPGHAHGILNSLVSEVCCQIADKNYGRKLYSICNEHRVQCTFTRDDEISPWVITFINQNLEGGTEGSDCWIAIYSLDILIADMNKAMCIPKYASWNIPRPSHLRPTLALANVTDNTFADFIPSFPNPITPYVGHKFVISGQGDSKRVMRLSPLPREINTDPIFSITVYNKDTVNILYPCLSQSEIHCALTLHEVLGSPATTNLDWTELEEKPELHKPWHKRVLSFFK